VEVPIQMACLDAQPEVSKTKRELAMEEANEADNISINSEDSDYEPEIIDSDYDVSDEDSDLKEDVIDEEEGYKGKHVHMADNSDDDLDLPDSDEESIRYNFKTFRAEDMHKPTFQSGQVFGSVELLRKAIREYSCQNRVDIKLPINDRQRLCAKCESGCPWYLWASTDTRTKCFQIKRFHGEHTCSKKWKVRAFTSVFLAEKYVEAFRADEDMNMKNFSRIVQKDWNMGPSRSKLQRARRLALKVVYGDEIAQYKLLWDFGHELRRNNPGSTFLLSVDEMSRFKKCYMCVDACKRGFLKGCRPVICLDGTHIKTKYGGQLLTAVGMDPNDCIYPIAVAIVEVENTETWTWFLNTLKQDLGIGSNTYPWTIMSDKQKVLACHYLIHNCYVVSNHNETV
jgi:NAD-dependent dihydropyrimidine dehydrogenase PreA subunit